MNDLVFARALMGTSLAFHIVYTAIGIGLPLMMMIAEGLSLWKKDELYHQVAQRWIRPATLLFAIGAVSGTILSFELGFLWPNFMGTAGGLIGLAFFMEGFAFFTEAIFLGLYFYGGRRLSRPALFFSTIPMAVAAAASAVFVISANGWMNTPAGFTLQDGQLTNYQPWQAFANPAWLHEAIHGTLSSYVAASFTVAGIYAVAMLRGDRSELNRRAISIALVVAAIATPLMLVSGDYSAQVVAHVQKAKFAAMEATFNTVQGAPLHIGGWPDIASGTVKYAIDIPKLLSFLGYRDPNATVTGLNDFPAGQRPDPRFVHIPFQVMVGSFFVMMIPLVLWGIRLVRRRHTPAGRGLLWATIIASPFGFFALEAGWFVTEFGRQPWAATSLMKVADAVTPRQGIAGVFLVFVLVYIALTIGLLWLLLHPNRRPSAQPISQAERDDHHD